MTERNPSPAQFTYWSESSDALLAALPSSARGLTADEAARRLAQSGPNTIEATHKTGALGLFVNQFRSPIVIILIAATAISLVVKDWVDAAIIFTIVLASALLSFYQEYSADSATEKLKAQVTIKTTVLRDGRPQSIPAEEVVAGDVVQLAAGSLIPADGVVLDARDLFVNQAVLTGETYPVEKKPGAVAAQAGLAERTNTVFMGTNVRSGNGHALIVQTGKATAFGQIASRLALRPPETEFERGIRRLGYLLSEVMFILVIAVFVFNIAMRRPALDSLLFSVALAVGLTPQLLPAIINTNLARGSQAMARAGVIVRRLASIENFGSMDVLCTDKTGTLTLGVISLDLAADAQGQPSAEVRRLAYLNASLQTGLANPLDDAILAQAVPNVGNVRKLDEIPYDFVRKRLSVAVGDGEPPAAALLITKGALENVLAVCNFVRDGNNTADLDDTRRSAIMEHFAGWSQQGYRVLGVSTRSLPEKPVYDRGDEQAMTFAGFLLFLDPPKEGVQETVADLHELGVRLKIITGDNKLVALHTAQTIGLEVAGVLTGQNLDDMHDEALWHAAESVSLFAEVDPNQKERIILALKKTGHVVGYMGDGINDAPSLHAADIGISVDSAVDVAKEAADFVLLKQDLSVLRQGIIEGRKTFANTIKYVFMATGANFGNMFSMAGASMLLPYLPLLPKQVLLVNFLTDLPEMSIATDNVDDLMIQQPQRWDVGLIRRFMLVFGALSSAFDFLTFGVLLWLLNANQALFHTGWLVESVVSAALVVMVLRTRRPALRSRPGRALILLTVAVVIATVALPYTPLAAPLGLAPLPPVYLLAIAAIVAAYLVSAELAKRWFYQREARRRAG
ncbi:MAG: magnesium-translocating P-type ATPase [Caldilineales bacterium]